MGATLQRRLSSSVTVLLTNLGRGEAAGVLERVRKVRKVGGETKVVSILWLEHCFRERRRVATAPYEIEEEDAEEENYDHLSRFL